MTSNSASACTWGAASAQDAARACVERPHLAMMGLYLGGFIGLFSESALNVALPQLTKVFGITASLAQWMVVGYMLVIGLVLPFAGILMKWFRTRSLTLFAIGAFFVGSLMSALAPSFGVALSGRLIQGIGTGLVLPIMFAVVLEVFPASQIGGAMGLMSLIIMSAPAIGPSLSGVILGYFSWRALFFIFAVITAVGLVFTAHYLVSPFELTRPPVDAASCVLSCLGFGGVVLGFGLSSLLGWGSPAVIGSLVVGVVALVVYSRRQLASDSPVLNLRAFSNKRFRVSATLVMISFGITLAAMYLIPQFAQNGLGLTATLSGLLMLPGGIVNAGVSLWSGKLYDRVGAAGPARCGFAISCIGAALMLFTSTDTPIVYLIAAHVLLMVGVPLAMSPCSTNGLSALPEEMNADGSTILNTMEQVCGAVCTAVATGMLSAGDAVGTSAGLDTCAAATMGSHYGFTFVLILAVIGLLLSLGMRKASR
ncbi:MFS transporter [Paratractidigestivibacter sp.]|uniref:MFS transporter n=1 Tax=Paratractidigestivibacter sp. TaxID=2847316 RepID=UPI002ABD9F15|nr:MFS transporter [Paratractidigestivibacter sp.]